jgi:hypothetical protein
VQSERQPVKEPRVGSNLIGAATRDRGSVRPVVFELQAELSRSGRYDERARHRHGTHDHSEMGAALHSGVREEMETLCPLSRRSIIAPLSITFIACIKHRQMIIVHITLCWCENGS